MKEQIKLWDSVVESFLASVLSNFHIKTSNTLGLVTEFSLIPSDDHPTIFLPFPNCETDNNKTDWGTYNQFIAMENIENSFSKKLKYF